MRALWTDLYELNMAASYLGRGMNETATFSLFVRRLPPTRGFLVAAGLDDCLTFLEELRFDPDELDYLREAAGFSEAALGALAELRFTGSVRAVPEGRVALAGEPLLEVTAPLPQAQLVETSLLNQIAFQTAIASKAARCVMAAAGRDVVDFSMRRTQGPGAAMGVARASAIGGCVGTSNVEGARRNGIPPVGTMAHSYVLAFPTERDAFRAFARDFPGKTTFLVDTFDTLDGVRAAIEVARELDLPSLAIRLDSGDLASLAISSRALLDQAGYPEARIVASGSLDELEIDRLIRSGAPIDIFGVGTKMGVSADAPYLDSVYKLVEHDGRPVMKLSSGKVTAPGAKQVQRLVDGPMDDILALQTEPIPAGREGLLVPVMAAGRRIAPNPGIPAARERLAADLRLLPPEALRLQDPVPPPVRASDRLTELVEATIREIESRQD